jgi:hypothetical protein
MAFQKKSAITLSTSFAQPHSQSMNELMPLHAAKAESQIDSLLIKRKSVKEEKVITATPIYMDSRRIMVTQKNLKPNIELRKTTAEPNVESKRKQARAAAVMQKMHQTES